MEHSLYPLNFFKAYRERLGTLESFPGTYKEALEAPLVSDYLVLDEVIGTAWHSIDRIVATHDTSSLSLTHTGLKGREIGLEM